MKKILPKRMLHSLALASLLASQAPAHARQGGPEPAARSSQRRAAKPDAPAERSKSLEQVHAFVDRAQTFQDVFLKIESLVALATVLWKDGRDAEYARQVFLDTHNFLKTVQPREAADAATPPAGASAAPPRRALRFLRRRVLASLAQFDPALANRLAAEQDGYFDAPFAPDEYKEPTKEQAARQDFDKFSGASQTSRVEEMVLLSILDDFRKKDVRVGDELFLTALARLRGRTNVEADTLLILGNYLFSGHPLPSNEPPQRIMVSPVRVGSVSLAADVVLNREGFTPSLAPAFLTAAAEILSRPVEDAGEQRRYSAAAFLLIPKAKEFAPGLIAAFAAVAQRSGAGLPADASGQGFVKRWSNEKIDLEATLSHLRSTVGVKERDRLGVSAAAQYSAQKDLNAARRVANEISDEAARTKLLSIFDYKQASEHLKTGELLRAEEAGARITSHPIRALFYLSLAAAYIRGGKADAARGAVGNAVTDIRKGAEPARRPTLLMMAAAAVSKTDAAHALQLFREALEELDASGRPGRQPNIIDFGWVETVAVEGQSVRFDLQPGDVLPSYRQLLKILFAADRHSVVAGVSNLKTEALSGPHLVAAGEILLETAGKMSPRSATR